MSLGEARALAKAIVDGLDFGPGSPRVGLFPGAIALAAVAEACQGAGFEVTVGAQNIYWEPKGAFTGENSAEMVSSAGGTATLLGHSERRHVFGESDEDVGRKVAFALASELEPVLCVGEKLEEREAGDTMAVVARQLAAGIAGVETAADLARVVIAYEPVWAIGTGKTATPAQGQEVHQGIRSELAKAFAARGGSGNDADATPILYGGSVKPANAGELLAEVDIDGLLVGGASLEAASFIEICRAAL